MKIFLAGDRYNKTHFLSKVESLNRINILESFYYMKAWQIPLIKMFKGFMLDSGAFTFMQNKTKAINILKYTYRYIDFINKYDIKLFFELDIDSVIGLEKVEKLRELIIQETGKKPIVVWHKSRGKQYFIDMLKEYEFVALGGIVNKSSFKGNDFRYINWFCNLAHEYNRKIHGLGFTNINLKNYQFDSVDSSAWTFGNRGKFIYEFRNNEMKKYSMKYKRFKLKPREVAIHNFWEWVKWSEALEKTEIFIAGRGCKKQIFLAGTNSRGYLYE